MLRSWRVVKTMNVASRAMIAYRIVLFSRIMDEETAKTATGNTFIDELLIRDLKIV
jgi:hypothetical protein